MSIGIIGGTGLYDLPGLENVEEHDLETPFGKPSAPIISGNFGDETLFFVARHGKGHTLLPSEVPYRANIYALKVLGAKWCISVSAVGSLEEEVAPGNIVIPDQFIDRTKERPATFFGDGVVAHVAFADPFCGVLREKLFEAARDVSVKKEAVVHKGGTYLCMEGPAFSTRAESHSYRRLGARIIGMTNLPEAKLAREAEIAYGTLALVTDYDCWRSETSDVDIQEILATLKSNTELAKDVLAKVIPALGEAKPSELAANALQYAILTNPELISRETKRKLEPIIGRYIS